AKFQYTLTQSNAAAFQTVKKASQSSLRQQRKSFKIVFARGVYVGENTSQAASAVRRAANLIEQLPVAIAP
ncbi:MAG: hypothetical protein SOW29_07580, partial [Candidatus Faecousia sp.]|nr:hypothetical protein [Candidatus Faecousia sp.]